MDHSDSPWHRTTAGGYLHGGKLLEAFSDDIHFLLSFDSSQNLTPALLDKLEIKMGDFLASCKDWGQISKTHFCPIDFELLQVAQLNHSPTNLLSRQPITIGHIKNCDCRREAAVLIEESLPVTAIREDVMPAVAKADISSPPPKIETIFS